MSPLAGALEREREVDRKAVASAPTIEDPAAATAGLPRGMLSNAGVMALQRLVGNAAVSSLLDTRERREPGAPPSLDGAAPTAVETTAPAPGAEVAAPPGAMAEAAPETATAAAPTSVETTAPGPDAGVAAAPPGAVAEAATETAPGDAALTPDSASGTVPAAGAAQPGAAATAATVGPAPGGGAAPGAPDAGMATGAPAPAGAAAAAGGVAADPHAHPRFQAMKGRTANAAGGAKAHVPAAAGVATAQAAAQGPGNEVASQGAAAQLDTMGEQQPGVFDKAAFVAAVKKAVDAAAPKNLEEADDFKNSGKAGRVKDEVGGFVRGGKQQSEKDMKGATEAPPDTSKAKPKPVTPMAAEQPGPPPPPVGAAAAMPPPRPAAETDLSAGPAAVDGQMAEAKVTDEQLKKSNEPEFGGALKARDDAREHAATAPAVVRTQEQAILEKSKGEAEAVAATQTGAMHGSKVQALAKAMGAKTEAKGADEAKRAKVASDVQAIYERAKTDVTAILTGLDGKVDAAFTAGEKAARDRFETYVTTQMDAYKDRRYSGLGGGALWLSDKLFSLPDEVNVFYEQGRAGYVAEMDKVIDDVAGVVGTELGRARKRIADGRAEVTKFVSELGPELREVGKQAEQKLEGGFDQLASDVDAKQSELVDTLAQKYVASRDAVDARITEMKEANKGFVDKAIDAVGGVIKTILQLKNMLLGVLAKAGDVIETIITDPIGFLGKLVDGVKAGLSRFVGNIATHLQNALMNWLFGTLGAAGITMPKSLDFAGILDLVMQVLGLTYNAIRARVVNIVGAPIVEKMEQTVDVFKTLATEGVAGVWRWIQDKLSSLEDTVLGQIKNFIIEKVIKAGITWILSLLNPAAAFIKACKAIYDFVMFIIERGSQIMEFVNSILDSVGAIAKGALGIVAEKVEGSLAKALPLAISMLASLLGLGGISEKIKSIIQLVKGPIDKAIDWLITGAVKGFKKLFGPAIAWAKGKYEKGKAFVKEKYEKGKAYVKGKVEAGKEWAKSKAAAAKDYAADTAANAAAWVLERFGISISKPVTMGTERHTLTANIESSAQVDLVIHSAPEKLLKKLRAAHAMADGDEKAQIAAIIVEAETVIKVATELAVTEETRLQSLGKEGGGRGFYKESWARSKKLITQLAVDDVSRLAAKLATLPGIQKTGAGRLRQIEREIEAERKRLGALEAKIDASRNHWLFKKGPHADDARSVGTTSPIVTTRQRADMQAHGPCHHKGMPDCDDAPPYTPDHQPPSELMTTTFKGKALIEPQPQRLYPHCRSHSNMQGPMVKNLIKHVEEHALTERRIEVLETERKRWAME